MSLGQTRLIHQQGILYKQFDSCSSFKKKKKKTVVNKATTTAADVLFSYWKKL